MSQKTNPTSLRLQKNNQNFSYQGFADFFFTENYHYAFEIENYISAFLRQTLYSKAFLSVRNQYRNFSVFLFLQDLRADKKEKQLFFKYKDFSSSNFVKDYSKTVAFNLLNQNYEKPRVELFENCKKGSRMTEVFPFFPKENEKTSFQIKSKSKRNSIAIKSRVRKKVSGFNPRNGILFDEASYKNIDFVTPSTSSAKKERAFFFLSPTGKWIEKKSIPLSLKILTSTDSIKRYDQYFIELFKFSPFFKSSRKTNFDFRESLNNKDIISSKQLYSFAKLRVSEKLRSNKTLLSKRLLNSVDRSLKSSNKALQRFLRNDFMKTKEINFNSEEYKETGSFLPTTDFIAKKNKKGKFYISSPRIDLDIIKNAHGKKMSFNCQNLSFSLPLSQTFVDEMRFANILVDSNIKNVFRLLGFRSRLKDKAKFHQKENKIISVFRSGKQAMLCNTLDSKYKLCFVKASLKKGLNPDSSSKTLESFSREANTVLQNNFLFFDFISSKIKEHPSYKTMFCNPLLKSVACSFNSLSWLKSLILKESEAKKKADHKPEAPLKAISFTDQNNALSAKHPLDVEVKITKENIDNFRRTALSNEILPDYKSKTNKENLQLFLPITKFFTLSNQYKKNGSGKAQLKHLKESNFKSGISLVDGSISSKILESIERSANCIHAFDNSLLPALSYKKKNSLLSSQTNQSFVTPLPFFVTRINLQPIRFIRENQSVMSLLNQIIFLLEKRVSFRQIKSYLFKEISNKGLQTMPLKSLIKGIRFSCSGRLGGRSKKAQKAKMQSASWGETSLSAFSSKLVFGSQSAYTSYGKVGVKLWLCFN